MASFSPKLDVASIVECIRVLTERILGVVYVRFIYVSVVFLRLQVSGIIVF